MYKSRLKGKKYQVEHMGEIIRDIPDDALYKIKGDFPSFEKGLPVWRGEALAIVNNNSGYEVIGWSNKDDTYTTIPLKLHKNCRGFLRGSPIGLEGQISFAEKKAK